LTEPIVAALSAWLARLMERLAQRDQDRLVRSIWINPARAEDHVAISAPRRSINAATLLDCESIFAAGQKVKAPGHEARQFA
jgi:hypothetical protein